MSWERPDSLFFFKMPYHTLSYKPPTASEPASLTEQTDAEGAEDGNKKARAVFIILTDEFQRLDAYAEVQSHFSAVLQQKYAATVYYLPLRGYHGETTLNPHVRAQLTTENSIGDVHQFITTVANPKGNKKVVRHAPSLLEQCITEC